MCSTGLFVHIIHKVNIYLLQRINMPVTVVNSNPTTSSSSSTPNKTPLAFTAADFQRWNQTTSMVHLSAKLVGKDKIPKVRGEIVKAIGEKKVAAVQALSPTKYRIQFTFSSYRHERDVNASSCYPYAPPGL